MAVKAVVHIIGVETTTYADEFMVTARVKSPGSTSYYANIDVGPFDVNVSGATVNAQIRADAQDYAETYFSQTFGLLDTVNIINPVWLL